MLKDGLRMVNEAYRMIMIWVTDGQTWLVAIMIILGGDGDAFSAAFVAGVVAAATGGAGAVDVGIA